MTLPKAIEMLQNLRDFEQVAAETFDGHDRVQKSVRTISSAKANYIEKIMHEIEPETYPCPHPKIWHDISDDQLYCMGCNQSL